MVRKVAVACAAAVGMLGGAATARAADVTSVFDGKVPCRVSAADAGVRICEGSGTNLALSWDGTPIDVNLVLPAKPASGPDGNFPLIGIYHGYGSTKVATTTGPAGRKSVEWAKLGYAMFSMSARGWGQSCGPQSTMRTAPACANGHNHLMDTRYEVRDAQTLIAQLADQAVDGGGYLVDAQRIGATGGSYGGGMTMALSALRNRIMLPNGSYEPWLTPRTKRPMELAVGAASIPWTDLAYALAPSGRTLDYANGPSYGPLPGVLKQSYVSGLYAASVAGSNLAPTGTDPQADLNGWYATLTAGEPYGPQAQSIIDELRAHHSSLGIDNSVRPAPLLISSGFTDDLFPVDEALRFRNVTKARWPEAFVAIQTNDVGHARGQNRSTDTSRVQARQRQVLEYFLKGTGTRPAEGASGALQSCTATAGPVYTAADWASLAPGEVRTFSAGMQVVSSGGDPRAGEAFDPIAGSTGGGAVDGGVGMVGGAGDGVPDATTSACTTVAGGDKPGTAVVRFPAVQGSGYTLLGSPTVIADVLSTGPNNQLAARLLDVAPDGSERLIARALFRPRMATSAIPIQEVFQLHPNGYHFDAGHVVKLELLTADAPYGRPSNGQTPVTVSNVSVRLPVHEAPDGDVVKAPAPKTLPDGYTLAPDFGGPTSADNAGPAGPPGQDGADGQDGAPGSDGADGQDGADGEDGQNGAPGNDGADGSDGADGEDGADGNDGADGKDGVNGNDGADGQNGAPGNDGADGSDGADGQDGADGNDGADGKDGANGNDGSDGQNGSDGRDGAPGTSGKDGAAGSPGAAGKDGAAGAAGATGQAGAAGPAGVPGPAGPAGTAGRDGAAGKRGRLVIRRARCRTAGDDRVRCRVRLNRRVAGPVRVQMLRGGTVVAAGRRTLGTRTRTVDLERLGAMEAGGYTLRVLAATADRVLASRRVNARG